MRPARIILVVIALVAGGLAALLVLRGGGSKSATTEVVTQVVQEAKTQVLVAKAPIGMGERLKPENVEWQDWPEGAIRPEYVTVSAMPDAPATLTGAVARFEFFPGEPIREQKLVKSDQGYLSAVLGPGMRGVSVGVTPLSSAGGFIVPNDHVDVVVTTSTNAGQQSEVVLSNVRVLAIGKRLGELGASGGDDTGAEATPTPEVFDNSTIATLELTPGQAESLINASMRGQLSLTLRSVVDFGKTADAQRPANASQSVRLIRAGKEQSVLTGSMAASSAPTETQPAQQFATTDTPAQSLPEIQVETAQPQLMPQ